MDSLLTLKEGYAATYLFLCELHDNFGYDQLGGILGGMSLLQDGTPADPAVWDDWLRVVEKARSQISDIELRIKQNNGSADGGLA